MSTQDPDDLGRVDDATEEQEPSSTTEGAAAEGRYDAAQGSPDLPRHPTGEDFPAEGTRYDDPEHRRTEEG